MKDFVVEDMEEFLDLSERVASPFKFVEVTEEEGAMRIRASIWMSLTSPVTFWILLRRCWTPESPGRGPSTPAM